MEQSKQDTIATLYALRGGLSVLSEISDEANELKEEIEHRRYLINLGNQQIDGIKLTESNIEEEYQKTLKEEEEDAINKAKDKIRASKKEEKEALEDLSKFRKFHWLFLLSLAGTIFSFIFSVSLMDFIGYNTISHSRSIEIMNGFLILGTILIPITLILMILTFVSSKKIYRHNWLFETKIKDIDYIRKELKKQQGELQEHQRIYNNILNQKEGRWSNLKSDAKIKIENYQTQINVYEKEITEVLEQLREPLERFNATYKAMQEQFSEFIDERDWENVDLIIFNYETGRALDLRDALIQVDNERRKDELVDAIDNACARLSERVSRGFGALQGAIDEKFGMLGSKISSYSEQMLKSSTEQTKLLSERLGQIANSAEIQEALLRNMDTSSAEMAESLENMRELANNTYYESKYNT